MKQFDQARLTAEFGVFLCAKGAKVNYFIEQKNNCLSKIHTLLTNVRYLKLETNQSNFIQALVYFIR